MLDSVKTITLDLETSGLSPLRDRIISCAYRLNGAGPVFILDFTKSYDDKELREILANPDVTLRGHNIKFDILFLLAYGYVVACKLDDTKLLAYTTDPARDLGLKDLAGSICGIKAEKLIKEGGFRPKKRHLEAFQKSDKYVESAGKFFLKKKLLAYNGDDVVLTDTIRRALPSHPWYRDVEIPVTELLLRTEHRGAQLDIPYLVELGKQYDAELRARLLELQKYVADKGITLSDKKGKAIPFNPNSSKQLNTVFRDLGVDLARWTTRTETGFSIDGLFLKRLSWKGDVFARELLAYKQIGKLQSTYVTGLIEQADKYGRIHGSFNQAGKSKEIGEDDSGDGGTATGRLTSADPNLQNIPSRTTEGQKIRRAFVATPGYRMFDADLKQIEPRTVAHYSQSPRLLYAYNNDIDTHSMVGVGIFGGTVEALPKMDRFIGKTSWLADFYGCYYKKLLLICEKFSADPLTLKIEPFLHAFDSLTPRQRAGLINSSPSEEEAREKYAKWMFFKDFQERFRLADPHLFAWREAHINRVRKLGYLTTFGGRNIRIDGLSDSDEFARSKAERTAVNYQIQGSAADIMKLIMVRFYNEIVKPGYGHMLAVVHDEILGEIREDLDQDKMMALIKDIMCNTVKLNNVPMDTDAHWVSSWADK